MKNNEDGVPTNLDLFKQDLTKLINDHCMENELNMPDYMIADYMISAFVNLINATNERDKWYGVHLEPGKKYFVEQEDEGWLW